MKNLARLLTRPGPSIAFWAFVYGIVKLQETCFPEPSTWAMIGFAFLVLVLAVLAGIIEAAISRWSSK